MFKYRKIPKHWKYLLTEGYWIRLLDAPVEPAYINTEFIELCGSTKTKGLKIHNRYAWDGPSGPTIDTKDFMRGSLVHDALYQLIREGHLEKKTWRLYADKLLRKICLEDGMSSFRAWYVYHVVRIFGKGTC